MDSNQARRILALYRPDVTDPDDSQMAEALDQVQRDPELAVWFERQSATNAAIRARLKAIPVPADLKQRIIANHAARTCVIPFPKPVMTLLSAAAAFALMFFIWQAFRAESSNNFDRYRQRMSSIVQRQYPPMGFISTNQAAIRDWFQTQSVSTNYALPPKLESLGAEGGGVLTWQNHKVSMLCLSNSAIGKEVWVFITDLANVPRSPAPGKPTVVPTGNFTTASWTSGDKLYLVTGAGGEAVMRDYLPLQ